MPVTDTATTVSSSDREKKRVKVNNFIHTKRLQSKLLFKGVKILSLPDLQDRNTKNQIKNKPALTNTIGAKCKRVSDHYLRVFKKIGCNTKDSCLPSPPRLYGMGKVGRFHINAK